MRSMTSGERGTPNTAVLEVPAPGEGEGDRAARDSETHNMAH